MFDIISIWSISYHTIHNDWMRNFWARANFSWSWELSVLLESHVSKILSSGFIAYFRFGFVFIIFCYTCNWSDLKIAKIEANELIKVWRIKNEGGGHLGVFGQFEIRIQLFSRLWKFLKNSRGNLKFDSTRRAPLDFKS